MSDERRTNEFLSAASSGALARVRQMIKQGHDVNAADYDNRTALMLSCHKGHTVCDMHIDSQYKSHTCAFVPT